MKLSDLPDLPSGGLYRGLVYHWSAGRYRKHFPHYHFCILGPDENGKSDGEIVLTYPILNNLRKIRHGIDEYAAHTRARNSGHVGISAMCMYEGKPANYGKFPPTPRQIESMCAAGGLVVAKYGKGIFIENQVFTHFDFAVKDGYTNERWDWMREGPKLRAKTQFYALEQGWKP